MRYFFVCSCIFLALCGSTYAGYGSISGATGQMEGTGFWVYDNGDNDWTPATMTWNVTRNVNLTWHYEYTLSVHHAAISHLIIETCDTFGASNISNAVHPAQSVSIGMQSQNAGNPSLPSPMYGIKFDSTVGTTVNISFDSDRAPIWGDFYAKCGNVGGTQNTVWNESFLDSDPTAPAGDGSINNHILVPGCSTIPEPATIALLGLGGIFIRRRRSRIELQSNCPKFGR